MKKTILFSTAIVIIPLGVFAQSKDTVKQSATKQTTKSQQKLTAKDSAYIKKLTIEARKNEGTPSNNINDNDRSLIENQLKKPSSGMNDVIDVQHEIKTK